MTVRMRTRSCGTWRYSRGRKKLTAKAAPNGRFLQKFVENHAVVMSGFVSQVNAFARQMDRSGTTTARIDHGRMLSPVNFNTPNSHEQPDARMSLSPRRNRAGWRRQLQPVLAHRDRRGTALLRPGERCEAVPHCGPRSR